MEFLNNPEVKLLIIGALISLISTLIGFFAQTFFTHILSNSGKVHIYIKSVYNKNTGMAWGFSKTASGMMFDVPLWVEIHNTKSTKQIIRNLNLSLYKHDMHVGNMKQVSDYDFKDGERYYGEKGSYSFLLMENEIKRYDLEFVLLQKDFNGETFDEVKLSFYDTNDKHKEYTIFRLNSSWKKTNNKIDPDWRKVV
ncbi:hypothetical protein ACTGUY_08090 [Streptococcus suis]